MSSLKSKFLLFSNIIVIITVLIITIINIKLYQSEILNDISNFQKKIEKIEINNLKSQIDLTEKMLDDYLKGLTIIIDHLINISSNFYNENKAQKVIIFDRNGKILYDPEIKKNKGKLFSIYFKDKNLNKRLHKFFKNYYKGAEFYYASQNLIVYIKSLKNFPYIIGILEKNINAKLISELKQKRELAFKKTIYTVIIITVILIICIAILLQILSKPYFDLVESTTKIFENISKGDLSKIDEQLKNFKKFNEVEIKSVEKGFIKLKEGMSNIISNVKSLTQYMDSSSTEIQNNLNNILSKLTENNKNMLEQLNNTESLSTSIVEIEKSISDIKDYAIENKKISEENYNKAMSSYRAIEDLMNWLNEISNLSEKIDEIINIISEIAKKTKLLSLNASIEASKAGEHGKGFSVVAEEIRKLADTSSKSTEDIYDYLKTINSKISEGINISKSIYQKLNEIKETADRNKKDSEKIAVAIEQQYTSISIISKNIIKYNEIAELNNKNFESIISSVEQLEKTVEVFSKKADELNKLMESFKI